MPFNIRGTVYALPGEANAPSLTGREILAIEDHFGLDGLTLMQALSPDFKPLPGYTRTKALYALGWVAMTRAGEILSIDDVLNDYGIDELTNVEDAGANPPEAA